MTPIERALSSSLRVTRRKSMTKDRRKEDFATVERQICLKIGQPRRFKSKKDTS